MAVNLTGAFNCARAVAPGMKDRRSGRIVNISSGAGRSTSLTGIQAYTSAKAGQIGLTRQLARELGAWDITVNNIAPGFVLSNPSTERQWDSYGEEGQKALVDDLALKRLGVARGHRLWRPLLRLRLRRVVHRTGAQHRWREGHVLTMPLTVYGAGAIGGTVGALLIRDGIPALLVDRDSDHVAAMQRRGLTIQHGDETVTVPVDARLPEQLSEPLDIVLLAVKAQHTEDAMNVIAPLLAPDGAVVSLQNGLCERTIAGKIGEARTIGCLVNFSADYLEPGVILYGGAGAIELGELDGRRTPRIDQLSSLLSHAGEVKVTDNIWGYLWGKMGYANMLFATALTDETMADIIDRYRPLLVDLAAEVYEVAEREGVAPESFDDVEPALYYPRESRDWGAINHSLDALVARRRRDAKTRSGIWRDLAVRQRPTEVDDQIGLAAQIGAVPWLAHVPDSPPGRHDSRTRVREKGARRRQCRRIRSVSAGVGAAVDESASKAR